MQIDKKIDFIIEDSTSERIDNYIATKFPELSRSLIKKLIDDKQVTVNSNNIKPSYHVKKNDKITLVIPKPKSIDLSPSPIDIEILYEDDDIVVVNKPAGMVVHPAPGHYEHTLVNALLYHCKNLSSINGVLRPGIVHRLDKDTSGVMIAAKNDKAHQRLICQFSQRETEKIYFGIVCGKISPKTPGYIEMPIGRHPVHRKKMSVYSKKGRDAITTFQVIKEYEIFSLLKIQIKTGRTHQIRVHLAHLGHPIIGDTEYGSSKNNRELSDKVSRQMLHAFSLTILHPITNEKMTFRAKLPDDMRNLLLTGGKK